MRRSVYILFVSTLILCFPFDVFAQWDAQISQYWRMKNSFNPSFAGESDTLQAAALFRQQWSGVDGAPQTFIVAADMPFNFMERKHGAGFIVNTDKIGLFKTTAMGLQYVYKKRFKRNMLNLGVQVSRLSIDFNGSDIDIPEEQKLESVELPVTDESSSSFDAGVGISWVAPNYYIGASLNHVLEPTFDIGANTTSYLGRVAYFTAGYNVKLSNPSFEFQPSVLLKADNIVFQSDFTARIVYNKLFNGGISWRKGDGFVFLLGANIFGIDAGYAYDLSTSAISVKSKGSHELFVRYILPMNFSKKVQTKHKSVRIL